MNFDFENGHYEKKIIDFLAELMENNSRNLFYRDNPLIKLIDSYYRYRILNDKSEYTNLMFSNFDIDYSSNYYSLMLSDIILLRLMRNDNKFRNEFPNINVNNNEKWKEKDLSCFWYDNGSNYDMDHYVYLLSLFSKLKIHYTDFIVKNNNIMTKKINDANLIVENKEEYHKIIKLSMRNYKRKQSSLKELIYSYMEMYTKLKDTKIYESSKNLFLNELKRKFKMNLKGYDDESIIDILNSINTVLGYNEVEVTDKYQGIAYLINYSSFKKLNTYCNDDILIEVINELDNGLFSKGELETIVESDSYFNKGELEKVLKLSNNKNKINRIIKKTLYKNSIL